MSRKYNFTCEGAPMQAEGEIYDHAWYFRSRHGAWSFEVSPTKTLLEGPPIFQCVGDYDDNEKSGFGASWMPVKKCEMIIDGCIALYEIARPDLIGHTIKR